MKIEIRRRTTNAIIIEGEYESLKDCCEKNGASLDGANLDGANLNRASLDGANLDGASLDRASLDGANLNRANLDGANLYGASLDRASLYGASLDGANLDGARNYSQHHTFFTEVVRQKLSIKSVTASEWKCIAVISVHRICWDTIKKQFGKTAMRVFKKLSKAGFYEWERYYLQFIKESR